MNVDNLGTGMSRSIIPPLIFNIQKKKKTEIGVFFSYNCFDFFDCLLHLREGKEDKEEEKMSKSKTVPSLLFFILLLYLG